MRTLIILGAVLLSLLSPQVRADAFELDYVEGEDVRLIYIDPFQTYLVPHMVRNFQNSMEFQKHIYGWEPWEKTTLTMLDLEDYGNASAIPAPFNKLTVYIAPKSRTLETVPGSERMFMLMNHELTHVANLDAWNSSDAKWRRFFGGKPMPMGKHPESVIYNYLATPRMLTPRWYAEGAAVFMETWMSGGVGRAQGAYDEMVFRTMVRDDAEFYSALGIVAEGSSIDFQVGVNAYLYGTRFISYMAYVQSPEQVVEWLSRSEDSEAYYSRQFEKVFGLKLQDAWDEWIEFEKVFQTANLQRVRENPLTTTRPLVDEPMGSISRSFYDPMTNTMIGGFRYPGVVAHIGQLSLEDGDHERIVDIKGPMLYRVTSPAWDASTRTLFFTEDNHNYRDLMALDMGSGEKRLLLKDARIGDLVFNQADKAVWGLRHLNGYVTLVRIPAPYTEFTQVYTWPYGRVPYEMDISADGSMVSVSMGEIDGSQFLRVFKTEDLLNERAEHIAEYEFTPAVPEGFVFSPDGRYLYGSSFITGVSNIIRYEIQTGDIQAVSNAESGFFRPVPLEDGRLLVYEFTGQGFLPTLIDGNPVADVSSITFLGNEIAKKHPVVRDWNVIASLRGQDADQIITSEGKYRPSSELTFANAYPMLQGYRDDLALGYHFQWNDPLGLHRLEMSAAYSWDSPSDERLHFNAEYHGLNWWAQYWHNYADFYDLFGPTERARKGDAFLFGYDRALIFDGPKVLEFSADAAYYNGLDTLPDNQNRPTFFIEDIVTVRAGLDYRHTRKSLAAVDHEKGWRWNLIARVDHSEFDTIPKVYGGIDFGFALPWKHSSVWFYTAAGWADGNRLDPLTNYYFGGFGNNYVDDREVKRYRHPWSLPGFEIGQLSGREYGKVTAEFNFPPIRFSEAGTPSLFLKHIRSAVFASALVTDPGEFFERNSQSLGVQFDLEFTLMHRMPMTLSFGWAAGFEDGNKRDDEWLLSLKVL